jgi:hypothetical protein
MRRKSFLSNPTCKIYFEIFGRGTAGNKEFLTTDELGWTRIGGARHSLLAAFHRSSQREPALTFAR